MSFLPYRTGAIFFPLKNHNNFAAEAAFLCRIVTVVTRFLHSLALARKERSDGIAIVRFISAIASMTIGIKVHKDIFPQQISARQPAR